MPTSINRFSERKYCLFPASMIDSIDFKQVIETSKETLRYSNDRKFVVLKWKGETPACIGARTIDSHSAVLTKLQVVNWRATDDVG